MTKTWQLRALSVYLTLGLPLAASCAKEVNTLEDQDSGMGAATVSGGKTSKAGATGKAGGTSSNAFGGTSGKAGSGTGGNTGVAGSVAADGGDSGTTAGTAAGGKGGTGMGGSASMVPADVLARAKVIVYYQTQETAPMDKKIQMKLNITNQSADALPMDHVKIRYWFTAEVTTELHQYYTGGDVTAPKAVFVNDAVNSHALMTFGGGSIKLGGDINASEIQLEITNNSSPFNQADDFSWQPADVSRTPHAKITLYLDDKLIWGCEPSGACFDDGAGGAGGQGAGGAP